MKGAIIVVLLLNGIMLKANWIFQCLLILFESYNAYYTRHPKIPNMHHFKKYSSQAIDSVRIVSAVVLLNLSFRKV